MCPSSATPQSSDLPTHMIQSVDASASQTRHRSCANRVAVPGSRPLARYDAARAAHSFAWHHAHRSGAAVPTSTRRQGLWGGDRAVSDADAPRPCARSTATAPNTHRRHPVRRVGGPDLGRHSWLPTHRRPVASAHFPSQCGPPERMWTDAARPRPPPRGGTESMTPHETGSTATRTANESLRPGSLPS